MPPNIVTGEDDYDVPLPVFVRKDGRTLQILGEQVDLEEDWFWDLLAGGLKTFQAIHSSPTMSLA